MSNQDNISFGKNIPIEADDALQILFDPQNVDRKKNTDMGLSRALYLLSKQVGFDLKMPEHLEGNFEDVLHAISIKSEFRFQKVFLRESGWWLQDNGPLLVIEKDTGHYDCLIPMAAGGYKTFTNAPIILNEEAASRYEVHAYTFFLPLPDRKVHLKDILKLSINPSRIELLSIITTQIILGLIGTLTPVFTGLLVDYAIPLADRSMLAQIAFGLFGASFCGLILTALQTIAFLRVNLKSTTFVESALWERLVRLPLSFYRKYGVGELIDRIKGLDRVYQEINTNLLKSLMTALWAIVTLCILFYVLPTVALIALAITVSLTILVVISSFIQLRYHQKMYFIEGRSSNLLLQIINGIKKIRTSHIEKTFFTRWIDLLVQRLQYFMKARWLAIQFGCIQGLMMTGVTIIIYYYFATQEPPLSLGTFIMVNALLSNFIASFMGFTSTLMNYLFIVPLYDRIKPVLNCVPDSRKSQVMIPTAIKQIEFKNVSFFYENSSKKTIDNVSIKIREGQFVAVVGPSGSGKSTLIRMLLGLEAPQEGKILLNNTDLKYISLQGFRSLCGVVLQTTNLMAGTLLDIVSGSDHRLSENDVLYALRLANLESEIKELPMGLQTIVMDHGSGFSLGQRQRLLIARALSHQPKLLVLDEATSALDNINQQIIHDNLSALNITQFVIAHRLNTIQRADYVYVMDKGRIIEEGSFKQLMKAKGYFYKMASLQKS